MSNPCNPTGKLVQGDDLARWVGLAHSLDCSLLVDDFYSLYIWQGDKSIVSASEFVE